MLGYTGEELEKFGSFVMKEAAEKRIRILQEAEENRKHVLEEKELEFLEDAYSTIQKEIRKIRKEKNEMISNAVMNSKKRIILKREEIIEDIFKSVEQRLKKFVLTPDYVLFLQKSVNESCIAAGDGEKVIYINKTDINLSDRIRELTAGKNAMVMEAEDDIIGGSVVWNKSGNMYIDNSLLNRLNHEKEEFLKTSGLIVEPAFDI